MVTLNILRSSRHFDSATFFAVIASRLNKVLIKKIPNGRLKTAFQVTELKQVRNVPLENIKTSRQHFGTLIGRTFPTIQPPVVPLVSVTPAKYLLMS